MSSKDSKSQITREELRKEIREENKRYRSRRRGTTFAVILVLIAVILLLIFAKGNGMLGDGNSLGFGQITSKITDEGDKTEDSNSDNEAKEDESNNETTSEQSEGTLNNNTIVVSDSDITFEGKKMETVEDLKEKLLEKDFTYEDVITLKEDKAIMSTYEEVKSLLDEMENVQYIEE